MVLFEILGLSADVRFLIFVFKMLLNIVLVVYFFMCWCLKCVGDVLLDIYFFMCVIFLLVMCW